MGLAMKIISNGKSVRSGKLEDLKEYNSQSLTTQAKKGEQLVSVMPAIKKLLIYLLGDDIVELHTENESLNNQIGSHDEKWPEASKTKLLKQIEDKKKQIYL